MSDKKSSPNKPVKADIDAESTSASGGMLRRWVLVHHVTVWHPPTDVYEKDGRLIVMIEIAGMRDGEFAVTLQGQRLTISGVRPRVAETDCAYHQLEIPFGEFRTEVTVPWSVTRDDVTALYRDGFLRIELPQATTQRVHIVNVDVEDDSDDDPAVLD